MHACCCCHGFCIKAPEWAQMPEEGVSSPMWVLAADVGSFMRAASAFTQHAISPWPCPYGASPRGLPTYLNIDLSFVTISGCSASHLQNRAM